MTNPFRTVLDEHDGERIRNQIRWRKTLEFMVDCRQPGMAARCLDIGDWSVMSFKMKGRYGLTITNTTIDLDVERLPRIWSGGTFGIITCFEVLEHLFNPLHCLLEMRGVLLPGGRIYLSTPRRKPLSMWDPCHFHEMSDRSLFALIERAGLTVVRRKKIFIAPWRGLLTGFRPWLRLFVDRVWLLELKHNQNRKGSP